MTKGNEQQTPKQSSDRWFSCRDFHVTTFRDVLKKWVALEGSCPNGLMLGFSSSQVLNPPFLLGICSPCLFKQSSSVFFCLFAFSKPVDTCPGSFSDFVARYTCFREVDPDEPKICKHPRESSSFSVRKIEICWNSDASGTKTCSLHRHRLITQVPSN